MTSTATIAHPLVRAPGAPGLLPHVGVAVNILVRASDTDGAWSMLDYTMPARFAGPPAHRHAHTTETFYCVAGEVTLTLDGRPIRLRAGEAAVVPPGVAHAFANASDAPATMLVHLTPGGFEGYFDDLAALLRASEVWPPADPSSVGRLAAPYDIQPAA
ncbi:cupin domain-containing protein [Roseisolibacter agri]|uniref:Cupin n=1 Tax=Roseisolibacter agri TaxID=2014610 RepID=A0AA37VFZ3_9BACT|nr:cupin domain-containing protein [Roseisolibacter agri]GLC27644.1 cupin [Roseisolibacter agri]